MVQSRLIVQIECTNRIKLRREMNGRVQREWRAVMTVYKREVINFE